MNKQTLIHMIMMIRHEPDQTPPPREMPPWMLFLLTLAWLRAMRPPRPPAVTVLRTLIIATALVLTVVALVAAGAPEVVADVLQQWPLTP